MNQMDEGKRITLIAIGATFFLGAAVLFFWFKPVTAKPSEERKATPVLLGTNELKIGAKLYDPHNPTNHLLTVIELNPAHEFPDEDTRPGVKVTSKLIGGHSWVPRENLNKFLVVQ